jgi:hypothetical protein
MNGGLEFCHRALQDHIQRNMSGKFRPDLPRLPNLPTPARATTTGLVIIAGLTVLYLHELGIL